MKHRRWFKQKREAPSPEVVERFEALGARFKELSTALDVESAKVADALRIPLPPMVAAYERLRPVADEWLALAIRFGLPQASGVAATVANCDQEMTLFRGMLEVIEQQEPGLWPNELNVEDEHGG